MNFLKPKKQDYLYDPFKELLDWEHPFFGLSMVPTLRGLKASTDSWLPAIDVSEDKNNVVVKADLPGLTKDDITIDVDGSILTIKGERKFEEERKEKNFHKVERSYGIFQRSLDLGQRVDQTKIDAKYRNGVLEITLPKAEKVDVKRIEIKE